MFNQTKGHVSWWKLTLQSCVCVEQEALTAALSSDTLRKGPGNTGSTDSSLRLLIMEKMTQNDRDCKHH